jgi:hypothetical protein
MMGCGKVEVGSGRWSRVKGGDDGRPLGRRKLAAGAEAAAASVRVQTNLSQQAGSKRQGSCFPAFSEVVIEGEDGGDTRGVGAGKPGRMRVGGRKVGRCGAVRGGRVVMGWLGCFLAQCRRMTRMMADRVRPDGTPFHFSRESTNDWMRRFLGNRVGCSWA